VIPPRPVAAAFWSAHRFVYTRTGGRVGHKVPGLGRCLMLTTTGRKSGQERSTALLYLEDGDRMVVVASNLGSDKPPAWWLNLQSEPRGRVRLGRRVRAMRGREATPEEREPLWQRLVKMYPDYGEYPKITDRPIPVVLLEPAA
jgi:deazaflavin-dependent oxidoreductase (nitroreductase family)